MASQLKDKVAIVTGSSSGLGEAIALLFASRGVSVTFCGRDADRLKSVLETAVKISGGHPGRFLAVQGDLNDQNIRKEIVAQTIQNFGHLDILVANAGVPSIHASFLEETEESYNNVLDTNLKSVFFLIQLAVPHLEKTKGSIVNISSIASSVVFPSVMVYSLSKAALDHLTRCLAVDLGSKGIRVNSVNPGYFPTRIARYYGDVDKVNAEIKKSETDKVPLKGKVGVAEDVAEAVAFLVSDAGSFITGESIKVDGGRSFVGFSKWSPGKVSE